MDAGKRDYLALRSALVTAKNVACTDSSQCVPLHQSACGQACISVAVNQIYAHDIEQELASYVEQSCSTCALTPLICGGGSPVECVDGSCFAPP